MKTNLLFIIIFLLCLGYGKKNNQQESLPEHGLLWKITGNGLQTPSYLFGTLHKNGGMQILDSIQSFDSIFTSCNQFICEFDIINGINTPKLKGEKKDSKSNSIFKPWPNPDSTYKNILTDKQQNILDSAISKDKYLQTIIDWNLRPTQAVDLIKHSPQNKDKSDMISDGRFFCNDSVKSVIIDFYLLQQAKKMRKNVVGLDSIEEIQKLKDSINTYLPSISYRQEVDLLIYHIQNYSKIDSLKKENLNKLISTYLQQDLNLLEYQLKIDANLDEHTIYSQEVVKNIRDIWIKLFIDERNNLWMKEIPDLMKNNSSFIAVGAGHLVGEKGLINQLRLLNYTVVLMEKTKK